VRQQARLAEEVVTRIHRFAHPVREQDECVAGESGIVSLSMGLPGRSPAGRPEEGNASRAAVRREDDEPVVPGAGAGDLPLREVEHEALNRDEHAGDSARPVRRSGA